MCGNTKKSHHMRAVCRLAVAGGALMAMLTLAGCSAGNLTGFDFPSFGLTKKSSDRGDDSAGRTSEQRLGNQ